MTEVQTTYRGMIKEISGKDWETDKSWREGNAGVAVAVSVLDDGNLDLSHLRKRLPEFTQTEVRSALSRLKRNGYFKYLRKEKEYRLCVSNDTSIEDGIFWALLANVAQGYMTSTLVDKE